MSTHPKSAESFPLQSKERRIDALKLEIALASEFQSAI
jgi:hypothetical protein